MPGDGNPRLGRYCRIIFWEFVQNLPMVGGFLLGLEAWHDGEIGIALAWMFGGSTLGAFLIWATESRIVREHREPVEAAVANVVIFMTLMVLVAAYLTASWSNYGTDVLTGFVAGTLVGILQDRVVRAPLGVMHCVAMATAFVLTMVGIRFLAATLPLGGNVLVITALASVVIVGIDYAVPETSGLPVAAQVTDSHLANSYRGLEFAAHTDLEQE